MGAEHDVVKAALSTLGTVQFRQVAMQPGMPQGFGLVGDGIPIFTLPGNPVSAYVSFRCSSGPPWTRCRAFIRNGLRRRQAVLTGAGPVPGGQAVVPARHPGPPGWPDAARPRSPRCPGRPRTSSPRWPGPTR